MPKLLTAQPKSEHAKLSKRFPNWKIATDMSKATLTAVFKRHVDAIVFIARLGIYAEVRDHHPEIVLTQAKAKVTLGSQKQLQRSDIDIMKHIDLLLKNGG